MAIPKIANMSEDEGDIENWWITGYGQSSDVNNASAIAKAAVRLAATARPEETLKSIGPGMNHYDDSEGDPWYRLDDPRLEEWYKVIDEVSAKYDGDSTGSNAATASCTQFAGGVVRATADPDFNEMGPEDARKYCAGSNKWDEVGTFGCQEVDEHCEPGDILCWTDDTHTAVYVSSEYVHKKWPSADENDNVCEAGYASARYPEAVPYVGGGGGQVVVYRFNGTTGGTKHPYINVWKFLRGDSDYTSDPESSGNDGDPNYSGTAQALRDANDAQKKVVDAAYNTTYSEAGMCAKYVSHVFQDAGMGYPGGNACDMYDDWCHSTDKNELKVGMIVAVRSSSSGSSAGATWGHVGVYIGDGKVRHNIGKIVDTDLDEWIATYCKWSPAGWGWMYGKSLA